VKRVLFLLSAGAMALLPLAAAAASSPTPSPPLDQVFTPPPAGFVKVPNAPMHGRFTTTDYTKAYGTQAVQAEHQLKVDGFVDGYGITWTQKATKRTIVQQVIAFSGGAGARHFLDYEGDAAKTQASYKGADPLPGIDPYYGYHFVISAAIGDKFAFVKGNDLFAITVYSTRNDNLKIAGSTASAQYNFAPPSTIPSDQWPENAKKSPIQSISAPNLSGIAPFLLVALLVIGLGAIGAGVFLRWKRWKKAPASVAIQLSPDGSHWWDGHGWRDSAHEAPPFAQRSGDGGFWWDGHTWRPMPASGGG